MNEEVKKIQPDLSNKTVTESTGKEMINPNVPMGTVPKKKGAPVGIVLIGVLLVLGIAGVFAYQYFTVNPTTIVKKVINRAYEDFSKSLNEIETDTSEINIFEDPVKFVGTLQFNDRNYEGLDKEKIEYEFALDYSRKMAEVKAGINQSGTVVGDAGVYFQNDKMYLDSDTLFDNTYEMGEYKFDEMFDFSELENLDMSSIPSTEDIDYVVRELKEALLEALDEKEMTLSKERVEIEGKNLNTNKISYRLNSDTMDNLKKNIANSIINNDELVDNIADMFGISQSEVKDALEGWKSSKSDDLGGYFSIYTTGISYELVKVEMTSEDDSCFMTTLKDKATFACGDNDEFKVIAVKNGDVYETLVVVNSEEIANFTFRGLDDGKIDFDYEIVIADIDVEGTIKIDGRQESKTSASGSIEFSINGEIEGTKIDYEIELTYEMAGVDELSKVDTNIVLSEFSMDDTYKLAEKMSLLQETALFKYFGQSMLGDVY